jgi:hypothetical protein
LVFSDLEKMPCYQQIVLHVGLSKTGTTSIQENCERHIHWLFDRDIDYPLFTFGPHRFRNHSKPLTAAITGSPGRYGLELRQQFPRQVDRVLAECSRQLDDLLARPRRGTLLLSSELIAGYGEEDMRTLGERLALATNRLRVVAYIRSPESTLASILQERAKAGVAIEPEAVVNRTMGQVATLQRVFPGVLEVVNFHEAVKHPRGLLGSFITRLGIAQEEFNNLAFSSENQGVSFEAFLLMQAINRHYPRNGWEVHGVERRANDLAPLVTLPGQPFHLPLQPGSTVHTAMGEEARRLESRLGIRFPQLDLKQALPMWQEPTLQALEDTVRQLNNCAFRECISRFLDEQAGNLATTRPMEARALKELSLQLAA